MPGKNILHDNFSSRETLQDLTQVLDVEILMCQPSCSNSEFYKDYLHINLHFLMDPWPLSHSVS